MVSNKLIPLLKVFMPEDVGRAVNQILLSGYITEGPKVKEFENIFGNYINNSNVIATNNCTSSIHLALMLSNVGKGDEVISTPMTCQSTNQPILQSGANIVWADIQKNTGNIDPIDIKRKITSKTKAIIMMHWAGQPCEIEEINNIAMKYNLSVIEDAASALGAEYKDEKIGIHSDYVCFSFQAVKHITTGDGGLLSIKSSEKVNRAILLRNNGNNKKANRTETEWNYDIDEPGWNFHMNDIAASIGIQQMKYQENLLAKRRYNAEYYNKNLSNIPGLNILKVSTDRNSANWIYTLLVEDKNSFVKMMKANNIQTSIVHQRNDIHSVYKRFHSNLPQLDYFYDRMINVPVGWWLEQEDLEYIVSAIKKGW